MKAVGDKNNCFQLQMSCLLQRCRKIMWKSNRAVTKFKCTAG